MAGDVGRWGADVDVWAGEGEERGRGNAVVEDEDEEMLL